MSLFSALGSAASALSTFTQALSVDQNNVNNSSTAGYATQTATFEARPYEQGTGELGGVTLGPTQDSRDLFAEQNVQSYSSSLGVAQQQVTSLTSLQNNFDLTGATGVPAALSGLSTAFSSWATTPNSATTMQGVLTAAQGVASAFQQTAQQVSQLGTTTDASLNSNVTQVNALAKQLAGYNAQITGGDSGDAGLSASIYSTIQTLSQYVNITTIPQANGTTSILLGNGQTSLVSGASSYPISASVNVPQVPPPVNVAGAPTAQILDANGKDITSEITGGSVAGLVNVRNQVLPAIQGDGTQTGSLNQLAKAFADRVNSLLTSSVVSAGPPVVNGAALFTYDTVNATNTAASLQVSGTITPQQLAATGSVLQGFAAGYQVAAGAPDTGLYDLGSSSTTSVAAIMAASTAAGTAGMIAVPPTTSFNISGAGFSGASAAAVTVNMSGVTNTTTLVAAITAGIQTADASNPAFANADVTASIHTGTDGHQQLLFTSGLNAITVAAGDTTANALLGNMGTQATPGAAPTGASPAVGDSVTGPGSDSAAFNGGGSAQLTLGFAAGLAANGTQPVSITSYDASGTPNTVAITLTAGGAGPLTATQAAAQINAQLQASTIPSSRNLVAVASPNNDGITIEGNGANFSVTIGNGSTANTGVTTAIGVNTQAGAVETSATTGVGVSTSVSNGTALSLANLSNSTAAADQINGQTYTQFFGSIGASVGSQLSDATTGQTQSQDAVTQAQAMRQQVSGVDLNQQAAELMQFEQAYSAVAKVVTVVDTLMQSTLSLVGASQIV
jgi:flagellar hook-associated protein 1